MLNTATFLIGLSQGRGLIFCGYPLFKFVMFAFRKLVCSGLGREFSHLNYFAFFMSGSFKADFKEWVFHTSKGRV